MRRPAYIFFILLLLYPWGWQNVQAEIGQSGGLRFSHWLALDADGTENIGFVKAIAKDQYGFMWFGGESGLARFNGRNFEVYRHSAADPRSLGANYIWDLLIDRQQRLWVASGKNISRYNPATNDFTIFALRGKSLTGADIQDLAEDLQGNVWIGTTSGLQHLDADANMMPHETAFEGLSIQKVLPVGDDVLWLGTREKGVAKFERRSRKITWYATTQSPNGLPNLDVRDIVFTPPQTLWVGTFGGGIVQFDIPTQSFKTYDQGVDGNRVWGLARDKRGILWAATEPGGLSRYDETQDRFINNTHSPSNVDSLASSKTRSLFIDENDDIWIGLFPQGIDFLNRFANSIHNETASDQGLTHSSILTIKETDQQKLWVGTEKGLNLYDPSNGQYIRYLPDKLNPHALHADAVLSLADAENRKLWVGTWGAGLQLFDPDTGNFTQIPIAPQNIDGLHTPYVWALLRTRKGELYAGGDTGGLHQWLGGDRFKRFEPNSADAKSISDKKINVLFEDSNNRIWVGTAQGLDEFIPSTGQFIHHLRRADGTNLFGHYVVALCEDAAHNIWFGTREGGATRYEPNTGKYTNFNIQHGLPADYVSSLVVDDQGFVWASTSRGIARIDPRNNSIVSLNKSDGLTGNNFNRNASLNDGQGNLYFGGAAGLNIINPVRLFAETTAPPNVIIANLRLFNKPVPIGGDDAILPQAITQLDHITLNHLHTMISFDFFALSFRSPQKNQYAYRLEGFDTEWNYIGSNTSATYTNLPAGKYTFRVKASDSLGHWNDNGDQLKITIQPPPWRSDYAYSFYLLACFVIGYGTFHHLQSRLRLKQETDRLALEQEKERLELEHEKSLNAKLQQLDKLKDAFLANTSHELRTPLNGIIGLSDALLEGAHGSMNEGMRHILEMISSSGRRLSYLINDILDFSKLSKHDLDLNLRPTSIYKTVCLIVELVKPLTKGKALSIINKIPDGTPDVLADNNRLQQILINLVGNAIKFTSEGSVTISCDVEDRHLNIAITDTGPGISPEDQAKLFIEFSRLDNTDTREQGGTGLGLAICKQLVHLHGGELNVNSTLGMGAVFYFSLPLASQITHSQLTPTNSLEKTTSANPPIQSVQLLDDHRIQATNISAGNNPLLLMPSDIIGQFTVLIVDDDAINRMVLRSILSLHQHRIIEANSGADALQLLQAHNDIDIVILDVMMPGMNGYETAMRIRVHYQVHHLPILFLTAKDYGEDLVRGFVAGGNDFLAKPVSKYELLTRVASHLRLLKIHRNMEKQLDANTLEQMSTHNELVVLDKIVVTLQKEMNPDRLIFTLLDQMLYLVKTASGASFWQLNTDAQLVCSAALAQEHRKLGEQCFKIDDKFLAALTNLADAPQPVQALRNFANTPLQPLYELFSAPENTLIAPIHHLKQILGFIALTNTEALPEVDQTIITALDRIKSHVTSVVVKAKLMRD